MLNVAFFTVIVSVVVPLLTPGRLAKIYYVLHLDDYLDIYGLGRESLLKGKDQYG
jgi:hypothetical protein